MGTIISVRDSMIFGELGALLAGVFMTFLSYRLPTYPLRYSSVSELPYETLTNSSCSGERGPA
jgi:hypothetical protein